MEEEYESIEERIKKIEEKKEKLMSQMNKYGWFRDSWIMFIIGIVMYICAFIFWYITVFF